MTKLLYTTLAALTLLMSAVIPTAFADSNNIQGEDLKKNPVALDILKKIENSRKEFEQVKEIQQKRLEQQKLIDEKRTLAKESLSQELERINKQYEDFTPRNAFAKFVSNFNATHQGIYWDQFDYLHTKVALAKEARDTILEQGGSYSDAMKQYVKFAKMSKTEMINIIRELNLKHGFAQDSIQSNFDVNGKLPRYENDLDAPCYGCTDTMTKVRLNTEETVPITPAKYDPPQTESSKLRESLSQLQKTFLESKDMTLQMKIVTQMNEIVRQIHDLQ
jgi:hypothetical protein